MRLDKYLKVSRLIKRRTLAKEVSGNERVLVNQKVAKPSTTLKIDDIVEIHYGNRITTIKVKSLNESFKKSESAMMFEILNETNNKNDILT